MRKLAMTWTISRDKDHMEKSTGSMVILATTPNFSFQPQYLPALLYFVLHAEKMHTWTQDILNK